MITKYNVVVPWYSDGIRRQSHGQMNVMYHGIYSTLYSTVLQKSPATMVLVG